METTVVISKDKLKSCRLWQWDMLDQSVPDSTPSCQEQDTQAEERQADHSSENETVDQEKEARITEEEIAAILQQARVDGQKQGHDEGLSKGYQEGYNKGYQEGRQEGESEIKTELAHVNRVFEHLGDQLHTLDQQVAQNLLTLAIDLAKKITMQAIVLRPELILSVVQDAVRQLPGIMQHIRLFLHPDDARIVRQYLSEQILQGNWEVYEDDQIVQSGCRIEAGGSEVDASVETRWRRVLDAIGQQNDWIEK